MLAFKLQRLLSYMAYYSCSSFLFKQFRKPKLIILMYHRVLDTHFDIMKESDIFYTKKENFIEQMKFLKKHYPVVSLEEGVVLLKKGLKRDTVVITFDDGYIDNFYVVAPIIERFHLPITIFVTVDFINQKVKGKNGERIFMNWKELNKLSKSSLITIGYHTLTHPRMDKINQSEIEKELDEPMKRLREIAHPVFAYPYGIISLNAIREVKKRFKIAVTTNYGYNDKNANPLLLKRIGVSHVNDIISFKVSLSGILSLFVRIYAVFGCVRT